MNNDEKLTKHFFLHLLTYSYNYQLPFNTYYRYTKQLNYDAFSCNMYTDKSFSTL